MGTRWGQSNPWGALSLLQLWGMALSGESQKHRNWSQTLTQPHSYTPIPKSHPQLPPSHPGEPQISVLPSKAGLQHV